MSLIGLPSACHGGISRPLPICKRRMNSSPYPSRACDTGRARSATACGAPADDERHSGGQMRSQQEYVLRTVEERAVRFVQLWFTDVLGTAKTFAITPAELENALE